MQLSMACSLFNKDDAAKKAEILKIAQGSGSEYILIKSAYYIL